MEHNITWNQLGSRLYLGEENLFKQDFQIGPNVHLLIGTHKCRSVETHSEQPPFHHSLSLSVSAHNC